MAEAEQKNLRDSIFTATFERVFFAWYRRLFSIGEIEGSKVLQWVFGATLFSFYITFDRWVGSSALTIQSYVANRYACWPYFQSCGEWYFLQALPYGYSQTILYMVLFALMGLVIYLMMRREWVLAHMLMVILLAWKVLAGFLLSHSLTGNYDYYHVIFAVVLLFLPLKLYFLKLAFVLFYTLSSTVKIHDGWIVGTYFSPLTAGLPIFPDWSIPVWTNLVIVMQIVGAWFLLSSRVYLQRIALFFFVTFHLYSGVLVEYRYPATVLPTLLILFGGWYAYEHAPLSRRSIPGWVFLLLLVALQSIALAIPGDQKLTLEGNRYGMYMFEANHQCISTARVYNTDGSTEGAVRGSSLARNRCDPYDYWFHLKQICARGGANIERIEWTFDHSINGGPFYRIIDETDACALDYKNFSHNEWIKMPEDGAAIIGHPVKNVYY